MPATPETPPPAAPTASPSSAAAGGAAGPHLASPVARAAYFALGVACTLLGAIGIAVPGLPTTPFLLLAGFGFSRSSPRVHAWLLRNRVFGPVIRQWHEDRSLPPGTKGRGLFVILATFTISILVVDPLPLRVMLLVLGTTVFAFVARLPVRSGSPGSASRAEP